MVCDRATFVASTVTVVDDRFTSVVGQESAVRQLRAAVQRPVHAYLFVGPAGVGKRAAALAFAAELIDDDRALDERHPDVVVVEREGASISVAQAREISRLASLTPVESDRKVLILVDFHLVEDAAPAMLKTIEEASQSTVFVVLAESVPKELVTVASRCVRIDFCTLSTELIESTLASEGVEVSRAAQAAQGAHGSLERARLLASDDAIADRRRMWAGAVSRLDGSGAAVTRLVDDILQSIDQAASPLLVRQQLDVDHLQQRIKETGVAGATALKTLEARHKREQRRLRTDELREGFATLTRALSKDYLDISEGMQAKILDEQLSAIDWAHQALRYNPNETLLLQGLFVRLSHNSGRMATMSK